jgi:hypothetical protein
LNWLVFLCECWFSGKGCFLLDFFMGLAWRFNLIWIVEFLVVGFLGFCVRICGLFVEFWDFAWEFVILLGLIECKIFVIKKNKNFMVPKSLCGVSITRNFEITKNFCD